MQIESAVLPKNKKSSSTYALTSFGKAFIRAAEKASKPVMDIGAAYGAATLPALRAGAEVIAVDINGTHLSTLANAVDHKTQRRLLLLKERFPHFDLPAESLSAVHLSQGLSFLDGHDIETGIRKIYDWLAPEGEVFVVSFTPPIKRAASFMPAYEEQKQEGILWAGQVDDLSRLSSSPCFTANFSEQIHHAGLDELKWFFEKTGFIVKEARYFGEEEPLPEDISMDGRERVGLIARKP